MSHTDEVTTQTARDSDSRLLRLPWWKDEGGTRLALALIAIVVPVLLWRIDGIERTRATHIAAQATAEQLRLNQDAAIEAKRAGDEAMSDAAAARKDAADLRHELESIRKQMEMDGAVIRISGWLEVWDTSRQEWAEYSTGEPIVIGPADASSAYLRVLITNEGRYKATVSTVGLGKYPGPTSWTGNYECWSPNEGSYADCRQRVVVEPQEQVFIRVRINDDKRLSIACSSEYRESLPFSVGFIGAAIADSETHRVQTCT